MKKTKEEGSFEQYLKAHNIPYKCDIDNGTDRITMCFSGCLNCPDSTLESCIWFYKDCMESRTYYDLNAAEWVKKHSDNYAELFRLLNFLNATLWPQLSDGSNNEIYKPSHLYTPRLYMTEDGCCDIALTTVIPLDFYGLAPLETEDYVTALCPEILNILSPAIFGVVLGKHNAKEAIGYVKKHILNDKKDGKELLKI